MYREVIDEVNGGMTIEYTNEDGKVWSIPVNEENRMYQEYLLWKEEQSSSS